MLHTKFNGNSALDSGEEYFKGFYHNLYGCGSHLGHLTWNIHTTFCSPFPKTEVPHDIWLLFAKRFENAG